MCCLWGDYMDRQPTWWIGLCTASHIFRPTNAMKKVVSILAESVLLFPNLRWETCSDCKLWAPLLQQSELTFLGSRILRPPILLFAWVELCVREKSEPPNTFSNICLQSLPWWLSAVRRYLKLIWTPQYFHRKFVFIVFPGEALNKQDDKQDELMTVSETY